MTEKTLGHRTAADVPGADEQNGLHSQVRVVTVRAGGANVNGEISPEGIRLADTLASVEQTA
jgi:hypothetical protein